MRLHGRCSSCQRIRPVSVAPSALVTAHVRGGVVEGTCLDCEERERLERAIRGYRFAVRYVPYCEDSRTPGLIGQLAGVTDRERREVKIRTRGRSVDEIVETLRHELRHVRDPSWDCGNRDVLGRGGPEAAT